MVIIYTKIRIVYVYIDLLICYYYFDSIDAEEFL